MYDLIIKTDAGTEPVTQAEIVNFIKYDESDATEISLINSMVKGARELIERYLNVSLKSKTYQLTFDSSAVDDYYMKIPYGPLVSVSSLTEYDIENAATALVLNTDYYKRGSQWAELYMPSVNSEYYYILEWISGYGGSGVELLPAVLHDAICETVNYWYERGESPRILPDSVIAKIAPYSKNNWI